MTATLPVTNKQKLAFSATASLLPYLVIAGLATLFDAYSSWQIISVNPIALEGNPIWGTIASLVGFGGAMVVRAILGILLLVSLWSLGNQKRHPGARRYARGGLRVVTAILMLLTAYHIVGTLYFS